MNSVHSAMMSDKGKHSAKFDFIDFIKESASTIEAADHKCRRIESDNIALRHQLKTYQADIDKCRLSIEALQCQLERSKLESEDHRGKIRFQNTSVSLLICVTMFVFVVLLKRNCIKQ